MTGDRHALDLRQLSRTVSHALRHAPWKYSLEPDDEGWVPVPLLLEALRQRRPAWGALDSADLEEIMARADKQRFEMRDGRIRALYGHSIPGQIARTVKQPPAVLYHGTSAGALPVILRQGLKPMGRQLVHLSTAISTARQVARRKGPHPRVLMVHAQAAARTGLHFYQGNQDVWLADRIPARFLEELNEEQPKIPR